MADASQYRTDAISRRGGLRCPQRQTLATRTRGSNGALGSVPRGGGDSDVEED